MWWIAAGSILNISDGVAGKSPLTQSWSQITYGQTNIKIFTVHVLLLKIKPGLFASVTLPRTPLFLSQFTHLCGMCFCVLKKQLLYHPRFRCCLWIPSPSPQGVLLAIILSWSKLPLVLKCCSVHHYEKPVSVSYSHLKHTAPKQGKSCSKRRQPLGHVGHVGIQALPKLKPRAEGCAGCSPTMTPAAPAAPWEASAPCHRFFWTSHWQNKQNLPFWIQLPFSPLGKYKLKLILTVLNNSTCTTTAASLPPIMRNAV